MFTTLAILGVPPCGKSVVNLRQATLHQCPKQQQRRAPQPAGGSQAVVGEEGAGLHGKDHQLTPPWSIPQETMGKTMGNMLRINDKYIYIYIQFHFMRTFLDAYVYKYIYIYIFIYLKKN